MAQDRRGSNPGRVSSMRLLAVAASALALLAGWGHLARAERIMPYTTWELDASQRDDHQRPSRPEVKFGAIHRGRNPSRLMSKIIHREGAPDTLMQVEERTEDSEIGSLVISVRGHDDRTSVDSLGWRVRVAAGAWPWLPQRIVGLQPDLQNRVGMQPHVQSMEAGWRVLVFDWADWTRGQPDHCCPLHAGLVFTCFDRAGNESEPSDTVWIDAPAK